MGTGINPGLRFVYDQQTQFAASGLPVFIVINNFPDADASGQALGYMEMGEPLEVADPVDPDTVGIQDIQIVPQPVVKEATQRNVGVDFSKLNAGSKVIWVSHTFVLQQMEALNITDPTTIWKDWNGNKVVGIRYDNRLYSIEVPYHEDVGGEIFRWRLICNFVDVQSQGAE